MTIEKCSPAQSVRVARTLARMLRRIIVVTKLDRLLARRMIAARAGRTMRKLLPTIESYSPGTRRRLRRNGISLELDPSDYTHWLAYFGIEDELKRQLYALARPGDTVIDVGTNVGEVLLNLAKTVSPGGRAIGFEANPVTHELARANLQLNPTLPAEVYPLGLGDKEAELDFGSRSATNSGADCIMAAGGIGTRKVKVVRLDDFVIARKFERIDLIKIDVEGYELNVLRGGELTIDRFSPDLFVELCDSNLRSNGSSARELVDWMESKGFAVMDAHSGNCIRSCQNLIGCFTDIIAKRCELPPAHE